MERLVERKQFEISLFPVWECIWCTFIPFADVLLLRPRMENVALSCVVTLL